MADVFISYRKADRPKAEVLAKALRVENLDVWWDDALSAGQTFDEKIQTVLNEVKAVVVLWSKESVKSEWVRAESSVGRERGVLVPAKIQDVNIPVPFNLIHTTDLVGWNGDRSHPGYMDLVKQVKEKAGKQHIAPLKPPPNRQLRALWRAIAVVAIIAVVGASTWVFKPWEAFKPADPAVVAKQKRDANIAKLVAFGIQPNDLTVYDWRDIAKKRFNPQTYDALKTEAEAGNAPAQAVMCSVSYWGVPGHNQDEALASRMCRLSADAGEPAGHVYNAVLLEGKAFMADDPDQKNSALAAAAAGIKKAAEAGFSWGQMDYGTLLEEGGSGIPSDPAHALELYQAAQKQGVIIADLAIGNLMIKGLVSGTTAEEGAKHVKAAADKGDFNSTYRMGELYRDGIGVTRDLKASLAQFNAAIPLADTPEHADRAKGMASGIQGMIDDEAKSPT